jgi:hypothetical protein
MTVSPSIQPWLFAGEYGEYMDPWQMDEHLTGPYPGTNWLNGLRNHRVLFMIDEQH